MNEREETQSRSEETMTETCTNMKIHKRLAIAFLYIGSIAASIATAIYLTADYPEIATYYVAPLFMIVLMVIGTIAAVLSTVLVIDLIKKRTKKKTK